VRVISASHQDLQASVAEGRFREDLFYRLCGFTVQLPPLRERSDKDSLFDLLLRQETAGAAIGLDPGVKERLLAHAWPGNVRQLRTCLRTLVALAGPGRVSLADVEELLPGGTSITTPDANPLGTAERDTLMTLLEQERWHIGRVAARLGVSRNTLYRKLRHHHIARQGAG
jgi:transcriptional regulator of acetoin/glycerol metabolism